jgi:hypothetical protein
MIFPSVRLRQVVGASSATDRSKSFSDVRTIRSGWVIGGTHQQNLSEALDESDGSTQSARPSPMPAGGCCRSSQQRSAR